MDTPSLPEPIRVVLVEDNRLACDHLAGLLNKQRDLKVVATADGAINLAHLQATRPHVALLSADLGGDDSYLCLQRTRSLLPETRVVVMRAPAVPEHLIAFIEAGANGFVLNDATVDDLVGTIRSVAEGADILPTPLTSTVLSYFVEHRTVGTEPRRGHGDGRLTTREREITVLIGEGRTNKEIARRLGVTVHTVKSHVRNILRKLAVHTRLQVAVRACSGRTLLSRN